jgi:serine/threonine protein kinase
MKNDKIKIADLGTAKNLENSVVRSFSKGTREYRSPELLSMFNVTFTTDVWSAGIVFYEMITFKLPFSNDHEILNNKIPDLDSNVPPLFQTLINRYNIYRFHLKL